MEAAPERELLFAALAAEPEQLAFRRIEPLVVDAVFDMVI
jgi:hypothetical protein